MMKKVLFTCCFTMDPGGFLRIDLDALHHLRIQISQGA
jgi:hypothetical protein